MGFFQPFGPCEFCRSLVPFFVSLTQFPLFILYSICQFHISGKPIFVSDNVDEVYGTYLGPISLVVNIFSIPKYTKLEVLDGRSQPITFGSNFRLIEENTSVMDRFLGTEIKVIGYKITVKIERLTNDNIDTYTFKVKNDFGQSVHMISVLSAGKHFFISLKFFIHIHF